MVSDKGNVSFPSFLVFSLSRRYRKTCFGKYGFIKWTNNSLFRKYGFVNWTNNSLFDKYGFVNLSESCACAKSANNVSAHRELQSLRLSTTIEIQIQYFFPIANKNLTLKNLMNTYKEGDKGTNVSNSLFKQGGAYSSAIYGSIKDLIAGPGLKNPKNFRIF